MTEQDDLMTVREVARACHRSEETVRRWIWSGKLSARKLGNQLFVRRSDVDALSQSAVREPKVVYAASRTSVTLPYDPANGRWGRPSKEQVQEMKEAALAKSPKPFTPEEAEAWLARVRKLREEIAAEFGSFDVTEALKISRGEEEYE
jgi:excisionase family DNA binding protein